MSAAYLQMSPNVKDCNTRGNKKERSTQGENQKSNCRYLLATISTLSSGAVLHVLKALLI